MSVVAPNNNLITFLRMPPSDDECGICGEPMNHLNGAYVGHSTHIFHVSCSDPWFALHPDDPTCPICRGKVLNPHHRVIPQEPNPDIAVDALNGNMNGVLYTLAHTEVGMDRRGFAVEQAISSDLTDEEALAMVQALLANGPISDDYRGRALLKIASRRSNPAIVKALLENGPIATAFIEGAIGCCLVRRDAPLAILLILQQESWNIRRLLDANQALVREARTIEMVAVLALSYLAISYFF